MRKQEEGNVDGASKVDVRLGGMESGKERQSKRDGE